MSYSPGSSLPAAVRGAGARPRHAVLEGDATGLALNPATPLEHIRPFADQIDLSASQSPEGVGRAIVALAGDPDVMGLTGQALTVKALAARYGVDVSS